MNPNRKKQRYQLGVGIAILVGAIVYLVVASLSGTSVYYYTLDELKELMIDPTERIRVSGALDKGSVEYDPSGPVLRFKLQNEDGSEKLPVVFHDVIPDNLMKSTEIVATGFLRDGTFYAESLLIKCPSRYEAAEEELREK
jgi:cytochrome c-type biogenesis protein CcmE